MKFDLSWFITIPGLLITGGVLLLLIALVILIVSGRKGKKNKNEQVEAIVDNNAMGDAVTAGQVPIDSNAATVPMDTANANMSTVPEMNSPMNNQASIMEMPMPTVEQSPAVMPMDQSINMQPSMMNQAMPEVSPEPVMPVAPVIPIAPVVPVAPVENIQPIVTNDIPTIPTPIVEEMPQMNNNIEPAVTPIAPVAQATPVTPIAPATPATPVTATETLQPMVDIPVEQIQPIANETAPIYGGVSPVVPEISLADNETHQIYGGADPLENTRSMPAINGGTSMINPIQPAIVETPTMITASPVADTIVQTPIVDTTPVMMPEQPAVNVAPVMPTIPTVDNTVPIQNVVAQPVPTINPVQQPNIM